MSGIAGRISIGAPAGGILFAPQANPCGATRAARAEPLPYEVVEVIGGVCRGAPVVARNGPPRAAVPTVVFQISAYPVG